MLVSSGDRIFHVTLYDCTYHRDSLTSFPNKISTLDLQEGSESHGEWIRKLAKTTRMTKIQNSQERSKISFPDPLVVIPGDLYGHLGGFSEFSDPLPVGFGPLLKVESQDFVQKTEVSLWILYYQ